MWRRLPHLLLLLATFDVADCCGNNATSAGPLDSIIRDRALETVTHRHSGMVYKVPLPSSLSGVEVAAVKLRGNPLWRDGVNINSFRIPAKTYSVPFARRLVIVYQNLGNTSSSYYKLCNYSAATPVVGLLAYDDGSRTTLDLKATGEPIAVAFPYVQFPEGLNFSSVKCVRFGLRGSVEVRDARGWHGCLATGSGHFVMVFPSSDVPTSPMPTSNPTSNPPPPENVPTEKGRGRVWLVWLVACGGGVIGGVALVFIGVGISNLMKRKRMQEMARNADDGVVLDNTWVGGSKMPSASMVRTQPVLEHDSSP